MLILLSPAKTLDFEPAPRDLPATKPVFTAEANKLAKRVAELSPAQLKKLMSVSDKLAEATHEFYATRKSKWDAKGAKQAAIAFKGDVYQGLDADSLTSKQLDNAQTHLRILSGLYGVLKPLDLIQPYRLEMGSKLKNDRGKDLYAWWGDSVTESLAEDLAEATPRGKEPVVVNLASNEYWSVVKPKQLEARVVTPAFKDKKGGQYKMISFFAKQARGMMARHLIQSRSAGDKAIESFASAGYRYNEKLSSPDGPVFTRDSAPGS